MPHILRRAGTDASNGSSIRLGPDANILDLGAGNRRRAPNVINLEIEATPEVDIIADGHLFTVQR